METNNRILDTVLWMMFLVLCACWTVFLVTGPAAVGAWACFLVPLTVTGVIIAGWAIYWTWKL